MLNLELSNHLNSLQLLRTALRGKSSRTMFQYHLRVIGSIDFRGTSTNVWSNHIFKVKQKITLHNYNNLYSLKINLIKTKTCLIFNYPMT